MTYTAETTHTAAVNRARALAAQTVACPHCGDTVAESRLSEHIEIKHKDVLLSDDERSQLERDESDIANGIAGLVPMAKALANVRDRKLYRENYPTFEAYCKGRWGMSRAWGNNHAHAATIIAFLSPFVDSDELPVRESQTRALSSKDMPEGFVADVWKLALDTTPHNDPNEVTAAHLRNVTEVLNEAIVTEGHVDPGTGDSEPVSPVAFKAAVLATTVEKLSRQWEHMTRKRAKLYSGAPLRTAITPFDKGQLVSFTFPLDTDLTELEYAIASGKPITVTLSTEKDAS